MREIRKNGSPDPLSHTDDERTFFLVEFPIHPVFAEVLKNPPEVGTKLALSRHQVEILRKCNEDTSLLDLMAVTGRSDRTKFRHQVLNILLEEGLIEMTMGLGSPKKNEGNYFFYLRNGATSQKMSTQDITAFIQEEGKIRFDQQLRLDLDWEKILDESRLNHFLKLAGITPKQDRENLLLNLGAGDYKGGDFYFNQTGVLFFSREPTLRMFHVSVVCTLFKGAGKAYILDRKELTGSLLENVEDALIFLKKHLKLRWEITAESTRRKKILELPEVALREAMVNAVCHRDYNKKGAHVMVEIFDDRIEIYNPGGLPKGLPEKDFGRRSVCRNPNIAGLLWRCNYIEKMGTGIERIRETLRQENCSEVNISYNTMFALEFMRPTFTQEDRRALLRSKRRRKRRSRKKGTGK